MTSESSPKRSLSLTCVTGQHLHRFRFVVLFGDFLPDFVISHPSPPPSNPLACFSHTCNFRNSHCEFHNVLFPKKCFPAVESPRFAYKKLISALSSFPHSSSRFRRCAINRCPVEYSRLRNSLSTVMYRDYLRSCARYNCGIRKRKFLEMKRRRELYGNTCLR